MGRYKKRTVFNKLISIIRGKSGSIIQKANDDYKYSKKYKANDHLLPMLYMEVSQSNGIRDINVKYSSSLKLQKEMQMPSFSQLSRLNSKKSVEMFRNIFLNLLRSAEKGIQPKIYTKDLKNIKIIDSTVVAIGKGLAPELFAEEDKSEVRISTLFSYSTKLPEKITIVPGSVGERSAIDGYIDDTNATYLFDRGYTKYGWYDELTERGYKFVTRQQSNAVTEEYRSFYTGIDNLYDYEVTMGTEYNHNKTKNKYREILYFENGSDEEFRLITNIFNIPAQDIVSLYKKRWEIECFFKWIKQHLTIKKWCGNNLNAISIQIYCALIVYILLLSIKFKLEYKGTLYDIIRKLRVNLFETYSLKNILTG